MSTLSLDYILNGYWTERGDPRTAEKPFMGSLAGVLIILGLYSAFVLYLGPRWMATRKAFSLRSVLIVYNLALSLANAFFLVRYLLIFNYGLDMFNVKFPSLHEHTPKTETILWLSHLYVISKFVDLLDTIFFVLRKKQSQVTGLHFYHHLTVPFVTWSFYRLCGTNRYVIPFQLLNSAVHTMMYAYYGLAALGPWIQPYLWWKRYLTQLQIVQFVILFVYGLYFVTFQEGYDVFYSFNILAQSALYAVLFTRFYLQSYAAAKKRKHSCTNGTTDANNNKVH